MTKRVFVISDTHFGHQNMYSKPFLRDDGTPVRPWSSAEEADEVMVERWNAVVAPNSKVYHLGDVAIPKTGLEVLNRLNGDKVLIAGNHDWPWEKQLRTHFRSVRAYWKLDDFILSHVPIHENSLRRFHGNIHGHLHHLSTLRQDGSVDPRYLCVCVEHTDYTPIAWEGVKRRFYAQTPII
jgi:calcineurin-like phosphoesterase family protein